MFLFFLMIQLVATAPRVSKVVSYKGVTMRSFRCGTLSGVGAGDEDACAGGGVAVARACAVGAADGPHARYGTVCSIDFVSGCAEGRFVRAESKFANSF